MPPKRKAMAETSANKQSASASRNAKAAKTSAKGTAPEESVKTKGKTFKYCNANTVSAIAPLYSYSICMTDELQSSFQRNLHT